MKNVILKALFIVVFCVSMFTAVTIVRAADDPEPEFVYPAPAFACHQVIENEFQIQLLADDPEPEFVYPAPAFALLAFFAESLNVLQLADDPEPEFVYPAPAFSC